MTAEKPGERGRWRLVLLGVIAVAVLVGVLTPSGVAAPRTPLASPAASKQLRLVRATRRADAGNVAYLEAVATGARVCSLGITGPRGAAAPRRFTFSARSPRVYLSFRVSRDAATGSWREQLRCGASRRQPTSLGAITVHLTVRNGHRRRGGLVAARSLRVSKGPFRDPTPALQTGALTGAGAGTSLRAVSGLVAAYGFDEGSGTTVTDASGNGNNGTVANTTWAATGKFGKALSFNGTNALVTMPDTASLHLTSGMTLEAWVNPSTVNANWRDVIYKGNDNFYLEATSTNASRPDAGLIGGGSYADAFGTAKLTANTWAYLDRDL